MSVLYDFFNIYGKLDITLSGIKIVLYFLILVTMGIYFLVYRPQIAHIIGIINTSETNNSQQYMPTITYESPITYGITSLMLGFLLVAIAIPIMIMIFRDDSLSMMYGVLSFFILMIQILLYVVGKQ